MIKNELLELTRYQVNIADESTVVTYTIFKNVYLFLITTRNHGNNYTDFRTLQKLYEFERDL